ncbi:hypothetical protein PCASD_06198 [Puccinia coronata f. sp. avenae]|uniref:RNase H type-1 domain-containing protein n=1 Tax=Puccinia coronata f. sp. avenae TaxID=200324 RepID=A0A2N5TGU5_9BASI|nr:hypothetical protein PCASD_06198 [Puccinia coronata f. sp. avenae]
MEDYTSDPFDIAIGLPQGSPLSVILYIIYNNSLLIKDCSLEKDTISIGYIDDVVHLAAAKTPQATTNLLSSLGSHSLDWGTRFGAIFDKKKAQFMWLTRRVHPLDPFNFGNQALKPCDSVKWLGVIIDKKLTYTAMFAHLEQKGTKTLNQLKQLGNSRWGLRERDRVRLMEAVLLPRVSYGALVWATQHNKSKLKNMADKFDNLAAIYTLGTFKSTPIKWHRIRSAVREAAPTFLGPTPSTPAGRPEMINIQYKGLAGHPKARCLHLQLSKEEAVGATISLVASLKDSNSLMVYTDGSYDLEKGGASAAVSLSPNLTFSEALGINPYFSNHECEAIGVLLALHLIQIATQQGRIPTAHVFTDNTGVLRRLDNCTAAKTGQYIFREIAAKWRELQTDVDLTFVWCPGHQGIQGNEAADQTAKEATDRNANPDRKMKANLTKLNAALNAQLQQTSKKTLKARISDLPIAYGSLINQLASEHSPLHHNLFKSKQRLDPSCPFCAGKETTRHLFDFCPQYRNARRTLLTQAKKKKIRCDWNQPHQLLKTPKAHAIVAAFLKSTGRFDYL